MSYGRSKSDNDYARQIVDIDAPKTVFMAIALSLALRLTDEDFEKAARLVWDEWVILEQNGVVPQKPRRG